MPTPEPPLTVNRAELGRLEQLGKGGTATVFRAPDFSVAGADNLAYKEYKQAIRVQAGPSLLPGLITLVRLRTKLEPEQRDRWDQRIVWPLRVVVDDTGAACGILMQLIPPRFFQTIRQRSGSTASVPREIDKLFGSVEDMNRIGLPPTDVRSRLALVDQVATTYAMMHRVDVVVGDISGRNIVYDPFGSRPGILVVDTDSVREEGTRSTFSNQPHTPHWEPPEALRARDSLRAARRPGSTSTSHDLVRLSHAAMVQNKATDVFKFGLLVIRILDNGRQRSVNRDPSIAAAVLRRAYGTAGEGLLRRMLDPDPVKRPKIREWRDMTHPGTAPVVRTAAPPPRHQPAEKIPGGQINGRWMFEEGTGWVRRTQPDGANG